MVTIATRTRTIYPTRAALDQARAELLEQLEREGAGPPLIGDNDLRTCLAAVEILRDPRRTMAYTHPARVRILELVGEHGRLSPKGFIDQDDTWSLGTVSYHFRFLAAAGLIRQVRRVPRRGAVEHFYELADR